jgi:hypothetical protein
VSAQGLANPVATSLGEMLPQDVQAAVISTVIANKTRPAIIRPDWADGAEIIALIVLAVGLIFLSRWTYVGIITSVVVLGVVFLFLELFIRAMLGSLTALWLLAGLLLCFFMLMGLSL